MEQPAPPVPRVRPPADYPGCPTTVDLALRAGLSLRAPRWGIVDFLISLLGFVILSVPIVLIGESVDLPLSMIVILGTVVPWIALGGWPLITTWFKGNGPRIDLGLRLTWGDLGWGVLGGFAALIIGGVIAVGLQALIPDLNSAAAEVGEELKADSSIAVMAIFALCIGIGAPIVEELAFRGLGYGALRKRGVPTLWVIVITTVVFSLFHLELTRIPILLASGAILGILRWRTRGLGAPIVAHAVNNLPGAAFLLLG
ncbi:MAG: CPBP family intramembrane metalloprotease [Actinobacteria bacterium]|nr:CPBP family intramembrane metalloprotease [Actinomycetota bacterium]